jgi:endonuclease/exonuclease/phosphatase family metal-dependent hydrolase
VVANFHGLWTGDGRGDTEERIAQSKKLKEFVDTLSGIKILCGDFNLDLNTESMSILDNNMKNLIRDYGITSTRNHFFPYPGKFCDYVLVDKTLKVNDFRVFDDEVSDHLALLVDFET